MAPVAYCESMCVFLLLSGKTRYVPETAHVRVHQIWMGDRADNDGPRADPHRDALVLGLAEHLAEAVHAADVAGVDADLVDRMVEGGQGHLVVEVDVADERDA